VDSIKWKPARDARCRWDFPLKKVTQRGELDNLETLFKKDNKVENI
jgi:hypothetical protein